MNDELKLGRGISQPEPPPQNRSISVTSTFVIPCLKFCLRFSVSLFHGPAIPRPCIFLAALILAIPSAMAQEWTRFRGPNGSGESNCKSIPEKWSEDDYNWKVSLPGRGHSSPVLWDDKVFLLSADPDLATLYVLCLSANDGQMIWNKHFPAKPYSVHLRNSFATSTPTVDAQRVYVARSTGDEATLIALDHTGKVEWESHLGPFDCIHGFGTSPILFDDRIILSLTQEISSDPDEESANSFVVALDRASGEMIWKTPQRTSRVSYSTPCLRKSENGAMELICCNQAHGILGLDMDTGKENWSLDVLEKRTVSSPVLTAGLVFATNGSGGGGNYLVAIRPGGQAELAYRITKQAPYVPSVVGHGDLLFLWSDKGVASCIHAGDGMVVWRERVGGNYSSSPIRVANRLYCVDEDGVVVVLAADRKFRELARIPLGEPSRSTPAVAGGHMYLRTNSQLFSVGG